MKMIKYLPAALAIVFFASCSEKSEDKDVQAPVVELEAPIEYQTLWLGKDVHVEADITDNSGLENLHMELHQHGGSGGFEFDSVFTGSTILGAKNYNFHNHSILIPANAKTGEYHFELIAKDRAGNSQMVERDVYLENKSAAPIFRNVTFASKATYAKTDSIVVEGNISAYDSLSSMMIGLFKASDGLTPDSAASKFTMDDKNRAVFIHKHFDDHDHGRYSGGRVAKTQAHETVSTYFRIAFALASAKDAEGRSVNLGNGDQYFVVLKYNADGQLKKYTSPYFTLTGF